MPRLGSANAEEVRLAGIARARAIEALGGFEVFCGAGGVVRIDGLASTTVFARVAPVAGRLRLFEISFTGDRPLRAKDFRKLQVGTLERIVNSPAVERLLLARIDEPGIDLAEAAPRFRGMDAVSGVDEPEQTIYEYDRLHLDKPLRAPLHGRFLRSVAAAYQQACEDGLSPAHAIADEAKVPLTAARSWIKKARQAGLLGLAEPGYTTPSPKLSVCYVGDEAFGIIPSGAWGEHDLRVAWGESVELPLNVALNVLEDETNWKAVPPCR